MSVGGLEQLNVFFTTLDKEREEKCPQCSSASFSLQVYLHIKQFMTSSLLIFGVCKSTLEFAIFRVVITTLLYSLFLEL